MSIHLIGNAHLDPAWMWRWDEGFAAFAATCRSALDRISESNELIFTVSSAACFDFIERTDPQLSERIRDVVRAGRWSLQGGWWVEPDCNLPSGESFIRQGLHGQSYFESRFGVRCDTGYCIDSFGHNANLPALLRTCGMQQYVFMRPEEPEMHLPGALIEWRSMSGDRVLAYRLPLHYSNFEFSTRRKLEWLSSDPSYDGSRAWMIFFGVGNHGGGPTKAEIADIRAMMQEREDLTFSDPSRFFQVVRNQGQAVPPFTGEFYPHAVGAYSANARIKRLNREAETGLVRAEILSVLGEISTGLAGDWQALRSAWDQTLLNQFHDTLGGLSTMEVMHDVELAYSEAISVAARQERIAVARIASTIDTTGAVESLIVFNPTNSTYQSIVEFELWHPEASERGERLEHISLLDSNGQVHPTQIVEASGKIGGDRVRAVAMVDVPSLGWSTFDILRHSASQPTSSPLIVSEAGLSNGLVSFSLHEGASADWVYRSPTVHRDESDTWGHGITGFGNPIGEFAIKSVKLIESGPLRSMLRIESRYSSSTLIEEIIVYAEELVIEHRIRLNWQERGTVCKLHYPLPANTTLGTWSIPYGVIDRQFGEQEYPFGGWFFASGGSRGIGVIAPAKTSASCDGNSLGLTIARSVLAAHHVPPHVVGENETLHYLDQGEQEFTNYVVLGKPNWQHARMPHRYNQLSKGTPHVIEGEHPGRLSKTASALEVHSEGLLGTLKRPHVKSEPKELIARIIESYGNDNCTLSHRNAQGQLENIELTPWEIATVLIQSSGLRKTSALED